MVSSPDDFYDLPFAISYAKLTWFLWVPLDECHRKWRKVTGDVVVAQRHKGSDIIVSGDFCPNRIRDELGIWFNPTPVFLRNEDIPLLLYLKYPLRLPRVTISDVEILFVAAVLSPLVTWETNTRWVRAIYSLMGRNLRNIANLDPSKLSETVCSCDRSVRRMGYHARVLVRAMQDIVDKVGGFGDFFKMSSLEARRSLLDIYGVGPKISMFLVQVTHGDLDAPCVDRHVLQNAIRIGMVPSDALPYVPQSCVKFIDNCGECPTSKRCAASHLMRWPASSILSSLLYYWNGNIEQLVS